MCVLVTGVSGFVGSHICERLEIDGTSISPVYRKGTGVKHSRRFTVNGIDGSTNWAGAFEDIKVVVHSAARVHVMDDVAGDPLAAFRAINTEGTINLAYQASKAGIKRFIFISSIKVNGEQTIAGSSFKPNDSYTPSDPYGLSKYEAEVGLRKIARETGMEVVIIRPPLIYGPGVKGNFVSMMKWLNKGVPLPLGAIHNNRSLVFLDNLVDLIVTCIDHPNAANETFLVSDDDDISTTTLLTKLAVSLNAPKRLLAIPAAWLIFFAKLLGKQDIAQRLIGSLQLDITKTKSTLNWIPPFTVDEGLRKTAQSFLNQ